MTWLSSGKTLTQRDRFKNSNELYADARSEGTGTLEEPVEVALPSIHLKISSCISHSSPTLINHSSHPPHPHPYLKLFPRWASWCSAGPSSDKDWLSFSHMLDFYPWLVYHHWHLFQLSHHNNRCHHIPLLSCRAAHHNQHHLLPPHHNWSPSRLSAIAFWAGSLLNISRGKWAGRMI